MSELITEVRETIKQIEESHAGHTPETELQIAQIKALIAIALAVDSSKRAGARAQR